jgi:succinoglycan biosynthesis transport protein ExoP
MSPPLKFPKPTDAPNGTGESAITPALLLRSIRKNWFVLALGALVGTLSALFYTARQPKIFEAVATVQFDPQPLTPLGGTVPSALDTGPESYWSNLEYFATQHQIITSRKVASAVVRKLGLDRDRAFITMSPPAPKAEKAAITVEAAAEILRARMVVKAVEDSRLATVRYRDGDAARAQQILSAIIDTYVDQNLDSSLDVTNKTAEWLDTQLIKLRAELESQEMDLHDFKKTNNLLSVSYDDQSNMLRAEIQQLNEALTTLKTRREGVAARLAVLQSINPEDPRDVPKSEVIGQTLSDLQKKYLESLQEHERLSELGKGENHPEVKAALAGIATTKDALNKELQNVKHGVAADFAAVSREYNGISGLFEAAKKQALELNLNELKFSRLRRSKDNTEKLFGLVLERSTESGLSKVMPFNNVRVLDRPLRPEVPISPQPPKNLAGGIAAGLLLGLLGAVGKELLDRTFRNAEEAERELGLPLIGSLPDLTTGKVRGSYYGYGVRRKSAQEREGSAFGPPELIVHRHPKSAVAEAARAIRTNLMFSSPDEPYRVLLVTSAGPAEGKTTVATSIAIAMAQAGQRVCLVDCDLRRPRIHHLFQIPSDVGVTTALLEPEKLDQMISSSAVNQLDLLAAGPLAPNPAELVHTDRFTKLLQDLRARYDRVVIDSPPVGIVTDGVIISTKADATLLVLRAHKTRRDQARQALRSLRDVGINCPGFVLNAIRAQDRYEYSTYYVPYGADQEPAVDA